MSDVLARLRVTETHGIRRFLYPLTVVLPLHEAEAGSSLRLAAIEGEAVPLQVTPLGDGLARLDFALSLAPLQRPLELQITRSESQASIPDPLHLTILPDGTLHSTQERFQIRLGHAGQIEDVVYDGIAHLSKPCYFHRTDPSNSLYERGLITSIQTSLPFQSTETHAGGGELAAWQRAAGTYADGSTAEMTTEITACKSWVTLHVRLHHPRVGETLRVCLPLGGDFASPNPTRTIFDTGIDSIYGQCDYFGSYLSWFAPAAPGEPIHWQIGKEFIHEHGQNLSRIDYQGTTLSEAQFQRQRWCHLVNGRQAVAIAITQMPDHWRELHVRMRGQMCIEFVLNEHISDTAEIGVCYHFLNDVPAIAAATNPQSILLPPTVEVLSIG